MSPLIAPPSVDWSPAAALMLAVGGAAVAIVICLLRRHLGDSPREHLARWTTLVLWLTLDLIAFGAFTRLTDSGLGCPDWPGCYGQAHPWAAAPSIDAAQVMAPTGPVTWAKAWIEMTHRYLAMLVGSLILLLTLASVWWRRVLPPGTLKWGCISLGWVVLQGLLGRWTVTWKLYPAIVTLHLLAALVLLSWLAIQRASYHPPRLRVHSSLRWICAGALSLVFMQVMLGGWVSTNYAVVACQGFPTCNGQWWPEADYGQGFTLLRELGHDAQGGLLRFEALVAIHWVHRVCGVLLATTLIGLSWTLWRAGVRSTAIRLGGLVLAQVATGIGNVVLQWPLLGAVLHTVGAAWILWTLVDLLACSRAFALPASADPALSSSAPAWAGQQPVVSL